MFFNKIKINNDYFKIFRLFASTNDLEWNGCIYDNDLYFNADLSTT